jgi:hypothetical protein
MIRETEAILEPYKPQLQAGNSTFISPDRTFETSAGALVLQNFCQPSLVKSLRADAGLRAFARLPQREHALLLSIAQRSDSALTLAHTSTGEIVGQVTLVPCDAWWQGLKNVYEVAIEVSSGWRRLGLAQELLAYALECDALEDMILLAIGLSWHWDTEEVGLPAALYRELIANLFKPHGFLEYQTTEPNISADPTNILLVRFGSRVDQQSIGQFINHMLSLP